MSDSGTNVDIEDVLSSIRRLVSTDEHEEGAENQEDSAVLKDDGKLVLTPAHRVDDASGQDVPDATGGTAEPAQEAGGTRDAASGLLMRDTGKSAGGDDLADTEDPQDTSGILDLKALEARVAGFEAAVAEQDEEWEPDGLSGESGSGEEGNTSPRGDTGKAAAGETHSGEADEQAAEETLSEPDAPAGDGSTKASGDVAGDAEDGTGGAWYGEDAVIDEDILRDMVSEIVRQELQGALGERITRNVRKLVRREIHHALMKQGIE